MTRNAFFIIGTILLLGCSTPQMQTEPKAPAPVAQNAAAVPLKRLKAGVCPVCGGQELVVLRAQSTDKLTECADCGYQEPAKHVPSAKPETLRELGKLGPVNFDVRVPEEQITQMKHKVLTLRTNSTAPEIESTLGLERFADQSEVTRWSDGRLTMQYYLDVSHYVLIVLPGNDRTMAPSIFVRILSRRPQQDVEDWRARLRQNGWLVADDKVTGG